MPATRPHATATDDTAETPLVRHPFYRPASEAPPPLTLCERCGAIAEESHPPGWRVVGTVTGEVSLFSYGVCPACVAAGRATRPVAAR